MTILLMQTATKADRHLNVWFDVSSILSAIKASNDNAADKGLVLGPHQLRHDATHTLWSEEEGKEKEDEPLRPLGSLSSGCMELQKISHIHYIHMNIRLVISSQGEHCRTDL